MIFKWVLWYYFLHISSKDNSWNAVHFTAFKYLLEMNDGKVVRRESRAVLLLNTKSNKIQARENFWNLQHNSWVMWYLKLLECPVEDVPPGWLMCLAPQLSLLHPLGALPWESWEVVIWWDWVYGKGFMGTDEVHWNLFQVVLTQETFWYSKWRNLLSR